MALALVGALLTFDSPVSAGPARTYSGPYFGEGNLPPDCQNDMSVADQIWEEEPSESNVCHYIKTGLNHLDSPQVDVLIVAPVSPTAERDMRIMRQSIEMWEAGIGYLSARMGLNWLTDGMDFHISVDYFDPLGTEGGEFTTYPLVDPEIVVIATNPVGGIGIGTDPVSSGLPCHPVANPLDFQQWQSLPGFNSHHDGRTGTYAEDCGGSGGNVCFAINGAIDPASEVIDIFGLFDLVSHEVGHCLTLGHVGDAGDGKWGAVPRSDIMAYSNEPRGRTKCVSTLDVEGVALRMSGYLDVDGNSVVDGSDLRLANDQIGAGGRAIQAQQPEDHFYASSTGEAFDCPQPDLGLLPGERTDWTPP